MIPPWCLPMSTRYTLNGSGFESRWGWDFMYPSRPALGPTQPPVRWVQGFFAVDKAAAAWQPLTQSSAKVQEKIELYLYSPLGLF